MLPHTPTLALLPGTRRVVVYSVPDPRIRFGEVPGAVGSCEIEDSLFVWTHERERDAHGLAHSSEGRVQRPGQPLMHLDRIREGIDLVLPEPRGAGPGFDGQDRRRSSRAARGGSARLTRRPPPDHRGRLTVRLSYAGTAHVSCRRAGLNYSRGCTCARWLISQGN